MSTKEPLHFIGDSNKVDFRILDNESFQPGEIVSQYKKGENIFFLINGRVKINGRYEQGVHKVMLTGPVPNIRLRASKF